MLFEAMMSLPDQAITEILAKFGPEISAYLRSVGFFDVSGPYKPTDMLNRAAMNKYIKASTEKNREIWAVLEKWLFPEMLDFGAAFIATYGLIKPPSVRVITMEYMATHGGELIKAMTQTDKKRLINFIWQNSTRNERPLARQILKEPYLSQIVSGHRAETVIRTERGRAIRSSASNIAKNAGATYHTRREIMDGRTRPSHRAMNGEKRPIDEAYSNGEMYPGQHDINCRGWDEFNFDQDDARNPHPDDAKLVELYE